MCCSYVAELAEQIKIRSTEAADEEEGVDSEFVSFFPSFIWVVRDFTLELEIDGKKVTEVVVHLIWRKVFETELHLHICQFSKSAIQYKFKLQYKQVYSVSFINSWLSWELNPWYWHC